MVSRKSRSKKQYDANSTLRQPENFVLFIDRSLGKNVISSAFRQAGAKVEIHDDHFSPDTNDQTWLSEVGRQGWIVITKDERIRYRSIERTVLQESKVGVFILTAKNLTGQQMADIFVKSLPAIIRFAKKNHPPFIATITRSGKINCLDVFPDRNNNS
ncbi:MAG: hypothetical protein IT392_05625 [Nitrospirae bacterium]|nr:hypothetical protein [Nitrospirota bacterium]